MKVCVLNAGSSTYKCSIYKFEHPAQADLIWKGLLNYGYSSDEVEIEAQSFTGGYIKKKLPSTDLETGVKKLIETSWEGEAQVLKDLQEIACVGHRIVHGGDRFQLPVIITEAVKKNIQELSALAPLHNPVNLKGIEILQSLLPKVPHVGVFDTAFHSHQPDYAFTYAIPYEYQAKGIRRFGFHGISHEYCSKRAAQLLHAEVKNLKIVSCHLGNGSSLAAIQHGHSIDTTMGFTPMEGVIMGTRCGSIDPGLLLYLLRDNGLSVQELDRCLNYESGLKGICGISDMRNLIQERDEGNPRACLAFDMLIHSLVRNIGSMIAVLGGVDVLNFTGGIGENVPMLRAKVCSYLHFAGVELDAAQNARNLQDIEISSGASPVKVLVIETKEELAIAEACVQLL